MGMGSEERPTIRNIIVFIVHLIYLIRGIGLIRFRIRLLESPCESGFELPGSITHGVNYLTPTENRPLGRLRRRWEDNIRLDIEGIPVNTRNLVDSDQIGIIGKILLTRF